MWIRFPQRISGTRTFHGGHRILCRLCTFVPENVTRNRDSDKHFPGNIPGSSKVFQKVFFCLRRLSRHCSRLQKHSPGNVPGSRNILQEMFLRPANVSWKTFLETILFLRTCFQTQKHFPENLAGWDMHLLKILSNLSISWKT